MQLTRTSIHWNDLDSTAKDPYDRYWCYFNWFNGLSKKYRYLGYGMVEFDCQRHHHFGFWWFNWSWSYN